LAEIGQQLPIVVVVSDLSSPETCIKPYENLPLRLIENPFLPTLKPEEP
jgi:hypothetical protein